MLAAVVLATACIAALCGLAGCAPKNASEAPEGGAAKGDSTAQVAWSTDSDCTSCHESETTSMTDASYLCATHQQQNLQCASCHADEMTLTKVHDESKDLSKKVTKLKKTEVDADVCISCHDAATLKATTADLALLTDANGKTVNPHDLPTGEGHAALTCASCHSMHTTDAAQAVAPDKCLSCHHQNVYECRTCHS